MSSIDSANYASAFVFVALGIVLLAYAVAVVRKLW